MKFINLYFAYLEVAVITMLLTALILISVSGFAVGGSARIPATLAIATLMVIVVVERGRRRILKERPELKRKLFSESRLFFTFLWNKAVRLMEAKATNSSARPSHAIGGLAAFLFVALISVTLYSSVKISANIANLKKNQAIVEANQKIPATFFNDALKIEVKEISFGVEPRVTAVIHPNGYPDVFINNEGVGYTTIVQGQDYFTVRVNDIGPASVYFFVERSTERPVQRPLE